MMIIKGETNVDDDDVGLLDDPSPCPELVLLGLLLLLLLILLVVVELVIPGTLQCNRLVISNQAVKVVKQGASATTSPLTLTRTDSGSCRSSGSPSPATSSAEH